MKKLMVCLTLVLCVYSNSIISMGFSGVVGEVTAGPVTFENSTGLSLIIKSGKKQINLRGPIKTTLPNDFTNKVEVYVSLTAQKNGEYKEDFTHAWPIKIPAGQVFGPIYLKVISHTPSQPAKSGEPAQKIIAVRDPDSTDLSRDISIHPKSKSFFLGTRFTW